MQLSQLIKSISSFLPETEQQILKDIDLYFTAKSKETSLFRNIFNEKNNQLYYIFILKYLYSYIGTNQLNRSKECAKFNEQLIINSNKVFDQMKIVVLLNNSKIKIENNTLLNLVNTSNIQYLSKILSITTIFMNVSSNLAFCEFFIRTRSNIQKHQSNIIKNVLKFLDQIDLDDKIILVNKLLVLSKENNIVSYYLEKQNFDLIKINFNKLTKKSNLLKHLYKIFLKERSQTLKNLIKQLIDNNNLLVEILSIMNMSDQQIFIGQGYLDYYNMFCTPKYIQNILNDLLNWWAVGKSHILIQRQSQFRCNLMTFMVSQLTLDQLKDSDCFLFLTQGIQKKLTDQSSKNYALLVWKAINLKMGIQLSEQFQKVQYFKISSSEKNQNSMSKKQQNTNQIQTQLPIENKQIQYQDSDEQNQKNGEKKNDLAEQTQDIITFKLKQPKNLHDCILGLRNPHQEDLILKKLPNIIKKYPEDLTLMWNMLMKQLVSPLKQKYKHCLVVLFTLRPTDFIQIVSQIFIAKGTNIGEKIIFMDILNDGVSQLSENPNKQIEIQEQNEKDFYFKKVKSKYFVQKEQKQQKETNSKSRRWGHTRIAFEKKEKELSGVNSLKIVKNNDPFINRFYEIANLLFFKIISKLQIDLEDSLRKHQILVHHLLRLLATVSSHLKNHFDKYIIIDDIMSICERIIREIKKSKNDMNSRDQNGGNTIMLTLQVLNKVSLMLDQFVIASIMNKLQQSIIMLKTLPNYGIRPIIEMIEGNIYRNISVTRSQI